MCFFFFFGRPKGESHKKLFNLKFSFCWNFIRIGILILTIYPRETEHFLIVIIVLSLSGFTEVFELFFGFELFWYVSKKI